jgi:putative hemolysin
VSGWIWLAVSFAALFAGTLLSTLVQSLRDLSRAALDDIVAIRQNPRYAYRVSRILDDVEGHAAATALPRTTCNLMVVVAMLIGLQTLPWLSDLPAVFYAVIAVTISSALLWFFSAVAPTSIARYAGERMVYRWSHLLRGFYIVGRPVRLIAAAFDSVVRRMAGKSEQTEAQLVQEEILSVVEDAQEDGQFDETERDMIEAVVRFRDKSVVQVMTPRTEMEAIDVTSNLSQVTAAIRSIGHSRIPVYKGTMDNIVGVFYVKDLIRWLAGESSRSGKTFDLNKFMRPAYFVPETKTLRELLTELLKKRVHIALVADEYGGTAGLVTFEDIIEEVFGDIQDEYEVPTDDTIELNTDGPITSAEIDARTYITDANDELRTLDIKLPESEDYDTVGGFVTVSLGRIPSPGETFETATARITVLAAEPTRVTKVRVEVARGEVLTAPSHNTLDAVEQTLTTNVALADSVAVQTSDHATEIPVLTAVNVSTNDTPSPVTVTLARPLTGPLAIPGASAGSNPSLNPKTGPAQAARSV